MTNIKEEKVKTNSKTLLKEVQDIKTYMKANKITYEQLSKCSGIPLNTLKRIFSGNTPAPRISTVKAIYKALSYPVNIENSFSNPKQNCSLTYEEIIEILALCNKLKSEKGEGAFFAIKIIIQTYLDENKI